MTTVAVVRCVTVPPAEVNARPIPPSLLGLPLFSTHCSSSFKLRVAGRVRCSLQPNELCYAEWSRSMAVDNGHCIQLV